MTQSAEGRLDLTRCDVWPHPALDHTEGLAPFLLLLDATRTQEPVNDGTFLLSLRQASTFPNH